MRKKSWKQVAAIVICAALLSGCTGENGQKKNTGRKEGQVVNIYCWNDEFKEIYDKYASDLAKKHDVEVNFVIISSDNNAYQINLDEALKEQNTCIDDDKVDLFLIEADYASKYVKSDNSIDVKKTVGLTDEDLKQQYDYTKKIVSENGIQKGVTWQATPGLFAYRRSSAKQKCECAACQCRGKSQSHRGIESMNPVDLIQMIMELFARHGFPYG